MKDGNKESTKELLAAFRLIAGADVSIFFLFANLRLRDSLRIQNAVLFDFGLAMSVLSTILCAWLFFLVVGMLHREEEGIAYQVPVLVLGAGAVSSLLFAIGLILVAQIGSE